MKLVKGLSHHSATTCAILSLADVHVDQVLTSYATSWLHNDYSAGDNCGCQ